MVVSIHYLKMYSHNPIPIQTCGVHLLDECSEMICFWDMLVKFLPSIGQKIIRIVSKWWFPTIIWKSVHAIQFKLVVYTYYVSFQDWFALGPHWPNFCPLVVWRHDLWLASICDCGTICDHMMLRFVTLHDLWPKVLQFVTSVIQWF